MKNTRGVFEKHVGSNVWWIRYADRSGRIRREIAGAKSIAKSLYQKRKTEILQGKKLPESLRTKLVTFSDLAESALAYSRGRKRSFKDDECRMRKLRDKFDQFVAEEITPEEIEGWLESHEGWSVATKNRYLALVKLTYRLAENNSKIKINPARKVRMHKENNERVRYLNQYTPLATAKKSLKRCKDEESRLLAVIEARYDFHLPEFIIALHTGMRRSEQYSTEWLNVNFERKLVTVPRSKRGEQRYVPLNSLALAAFKSLLPNMATSNLVFLNQDADDSLRGNRHWFDSAVAEAGIHDFTWHDLRHTFASRLIMKGVGIKKVQELMGHGSIGMTARYTHLEPAGQLEAVELLVGYGSKLEHRQSEKHHALVFQRRRWRRLPLEKRNLVSSG
jgi:site-specific recombinase XerD